MAFVRPFLGNPSRLPGSRGYWRGLGQGVWCVGRIRTGGNYSSGGPGVILLTPDDRPGTTFRVENKPGDDMVNRIQSMVGNTGRVAVDGQELSDGRIIQTGGWGKLQPNEPYTTQTFGPDSCLESLGYAAQPGDVEQEGGGAEEAPPPPWTGEQAATIRYDGSTRTVTVFGADGVTYVLDKAGTPAEIVTELSGTAPQGTRLVITGAWDPGAGDVAVSDWYIEELGEGEKKYGIDEGKLVPQSPDVPSTDWPGGLPTDDPRHPEYEPDAEPVQAGMGAAGWLLAAAILGTVAREKGLI